jgi:PhnB protein
MTVASALKLTPFLLFDGNCSEAMEFYRACLDGELVATRVRDMAEHAPGDVRDKVAHAHLTSGRIEFSATDWQHQARTGAGKTGSRCTSTARSTRRRRSSTGSDGADPGLLDEWRELAFGMYAHLADRFGALVLPRGAAGP